MVYHRKTNKANSDVSIGSINVRGINDFVKRNSMFKWVRKNDFDITLLQETFSSFENEDVWRREWGGKIIFAHGTNHSKGTMILIKQNFDLKILQEKLDDHGRL